MRIEAKESEIQKACIDWLCTLPGVKVWRQNTGAFSGEYKGKKRFVRLGQKGQADITGIGPSGVRIEIEVKRFGIKPSAEQEEWLQMIKDRGGIAFYVWSLGGCVYQFRESFLLRDFKWLERWEA